MPARKLHPSQPGIRLLNYHGSGAHCAALIIPVAHSLCVDTIDVKYLIHFDIKGAYYPCSDDELLSAGNNSYTYDADGDRISETINGVTTAFAYDYDNQLVSITTGTSVVGYAYDALGRRVSRTAGGVTTASLYDGIGSARTFTNAYGVVTAAATYDDFGNTMANTGFTASPYQFGATSGYRNDGDAGIMQGGRDILRPHYRKLPDQGHRTQPACVCLLRR